MGDIDYAPSWAPSSSGQLGLLENPLVIISMPFSDIPLGRQLSFRAPFEVCYPVLTWQDVFFAVIVKTATGRRHEWSF